MMWVLRMKMSVAPGESAPLPSYLNASVMGLLTLSSHFRGRFDALPLISQAHRSYRMDCVL
jgi:hypothetical protein